MGGEAQEGRGVYILTDSQCLTAAASNYLPIKNEKKKNRWRSEDPCFTLLRLPSNPSWTWSWRSQLPAVLGGRQ